MTGTVWHESRRLRTLGVDLGLGCTLLFLSACSRESWLAEYNEIRGDSYVLDDFDRSVEPDEPAVCPEVTLEAFAGEAVRFSPKVQVFPPFAQRLRRFETVVVMVSQRFYERAPLRIVNAGAYLCRPVRHRPTRLSEHALGNAIDVVGFHFGPLPASASAETSQLPPELRAAFSVSIESAWHATAGTPAIHRKFLEALTAALDEQDVFRTMLGPAHPAHGTHFHFDMAPYSYVLL